MRASVSLRVEPEVIARLEGVVDLRAGSRGGRLAELLRAEAELYETVYRLVKEAFFDLSRRLRELAGFPAADPVPPRLFPARSSRWPEPVDLEFLAAVGIAAVLERAGLADSAAADYVEFPMSGGLLAQWGRAVGEVEGFSPELSAALGEFCRSWVCGISCRYGNLDAVVGELEFAFAGGLTGRAGDGVVMWAPAERRLFPAAPAEREAYALAWRAVRRVLEGVRDGRFRVGPDGVRLRDAEGVPAALAVLEETAAGG